MEIAKLKEYDQKIKALVLQKKFGMGKTQGGNYYSSVKKTIPCRPVCVTKKRDDYPEYRAFLTS
jgi:hypothetical protein